MATLGQIRRLCTNLAGISSRKFHINVIVNQRRSKYSRSRLMFNNHTTTCIRSKELNCNLHADFFQTSACTRGKDNYWKELLDTDTEVQDPENVDLDTGGHRVKKILDDAQNLDEDIAEPEFPSDVCDFDNAHWERSQAKHSYRPKINPKETSILLFPGQGSQFVGMGQKLLPYPNVQEMYNIASDILGYDLLDICLNGPKEELDKTVNSQAAIYVTSLAAVQKLKEENPKAIESCVSAAGFSVGEYAALVFAGALTFENGLEVVKVRGESMQHASEMTSSGMMTVFLRPQSKLNFACLMARKYCSEKLGLEDPVCTVANYLYPECKVIAGHTQALDFIEKNSKEFGLGPLKRLPVSGAFHTKLMKPAVKRLQKALANVEMERSIIPVYSNVTSHKYTKTETTRKLLLQHLYQPVKWEQTLQVLYARKQEDEFPHTFELGPGKQLGILLRKTNAKAYRSYTYVDV